MELEAQMKQTKTPQEARQKTQSDDNKDPSMCAERAISIWIIMEQCLVISSFGLEHGF